MPRTSQVHKADHTQHLLVSHFGSHCRFHRDNAFPVHSYRTGKGILSHTCKTSLVLLNNVVIIKALQTMCANITVSIYGKCTEFLIFCKRAHISLSSSSEFQESQIKNIFYIERNYSPVANSWIFICQPPELFIHFPIEVFTQKERPKAI